MECFICKFPVRKGAQYVAIVRTVERRTWFGWIKVKKAKTLRVMHPWCERQMDAMMLISLYAIRGRAS